MKGLQLKLQSKEDNFFSPNFHYFEIKSQTKIYLRRRRIQNKKKHATPKHSAQWKFVHAHSTLWDLLWGEKDSSPILCFALAAESSWQTMVSTTMLVVRWDLLWYKDVEELDHTCALDTAHFRQYIVYSFILMNITWSLMQLFRFINLMAKMITCSFHRIAESLVLWKSTK